MALGDRFLLDQFEFEVTRDGYRIWAADDAAPVADVVEPLPASCQVCMLKSGFEFRCGDLSDTERKIAACRALGL